MEQKEQSIQWHPAFLAGMQIELGEEANHLSFESEHQLGTKPMAIDILIKKEKKREIKKNIGQIFRTYNVIEYKSLHTIFETGLKVFALGMHVFISQIRRI